jgi:hypothetical protein
VNYPSGHISKGISMIHYLNVCALERIFEGLRSSFLAKELNMNDDPKFSHSPVSPASESPFTCKAVL